MPGPRSQGSKVTEPTQRQPRSLMLLHLQLYEYPPTGSSWGDPDKPQLGLN